MSRRPRNLAPKSIERSLSIVVVVFLSLLRGWATPFTQGEPAPIALELGKPIESSLSSDQTHSYNLTLAPGQYAHVAVDQRGIDVVVVVNGPDGVKIVEIDSPNLNYGLEPVSLVADS